VWQIKDFKPCVFGSVANKGVMGTFHGCMAKKGLTGFWLQFGANRNVEKSGTRGRKPGFPWLYYTRAASEINGEPEFQGQVNLR
jgi:hypothetical protein